MALRGTLTHRKTRRLAIAMGIPPCFALGVLESLWHVTGEQAPNGAIGRMTDQDIAMEMFYEGDPDKLISDLKISGLVDVSDEHRLIVHDWHIHSDDATDNKLARAGQRYANGEIPRMRRLSKPERAHMAAQYRTPCESVRTESHEKPLPVPEPEPEPVPDPVPVKIQKPLASTAVAVPAARGVLRGVLPLSGNRTYEVCDDDYARDGPLYPGIDLTYEYRGMKAWLLANPKHQKTPQGIRRFMNTWLSKAQDKSKPQGAGNGTAFKSKSESTIEALHANHEGRRNRDPFGDVVSGAAGECEEAGVRPVYAIPDAVRTEAHQDSNRAVVIEATR